MGSFFFTADVCVISVCGPFLQRQISTLLLILGKMAGGVMDVGVLWDIDGDMMGRDGEEEGEGMGNHLHG